MKKQYLAATASVVIGIFALVWIINYLHTGKIIITTNNRSDAIVLTGVNGTKFSMKANEQLSVTVKSGHYIAYVTRNYQGNLAQTNQLITLTGRKTMRYNLNPTDSLVYEPVVDENAQDMAVSNTLFYVDGGSNNLYQIDSQNNITQASSNQKFQSIKWASAAFGVGQDYHGDLYTINNGTVVQLKIPTTYANYYAVSPDGHIYISYGKAVYRGTVAANFVKIYTSKSVFTSLAAFDNGVAVVAGLLGDDGPPSYKPSVTVVDNTGRVVKKNLEASSSTAWSPDGKYLLTKSASGFIILDGALNEVTTIPND